MFLSNEILVATNETYILFIQTCTPTPCNITTQSIMISSHNFQCKNNSQHQPYTPKKNSKTFPLFKSNKHLFPFPYVNFCLLMFGQHFPKLSHAISQSTSFC